MLYQQLAEGDAEEVSIPSPWTEIDQVELNTLRNAPIDMSNTVYGWFEKQKKREVEVSIPEDVHQGERGFKWKMVGIDKAGAGNGETLSPIPTPIDHV